MFEFLDAYLGEAMALLTAVTWASAVILFKKSGEAVHPIGLNLFKGVLAAILLIPTMWFFGESLFRPVPQSDYLLLLASGALGIGIADTLFFKSLNILGAGFSAIVDCLYSPFIIALSMLWINETLSLWQLIGAVMIVSAVLTAVGERRAGPAGRKAILIGVLWGVLAMAAMAVGIVMIKPLLSRSPLLWATEWRVVGGVVVLLLVLLFHPSRSTILTSIKTRGRLAYTITGSFLGGYLAMLFWLSGMKLIQASTASALNQTSNVFLFVLAAIFLKEKITPHRLVGIILGVSGLFLVTFG
jgi:drug/metabolite transporter (DMT)-like permease